VEQVTDQFEYGDKVEHQAFGIGQVLAFIGDGERLKLLIKFKDHGEKKIAVRHARLKRLSDRPTLTVLPASPVLVTTKQDMDLNKIKKIILPAAEAAFDDLGSAEDEEILDDDDDGDSEFESLEELGEEEEEDAEDEE
jgi:hypothetical protein